MTKIRTVFILALLLFTSLGAAAQTAAQTPVRAPAPAQTTPETVIRSDLDARATREQLRELMQRFPPDLGRILKLDPSLLQSQPYLAQYPALAAFLATHPEVAHNPNYFLEFVYLNRDDFQPADSRSQAINMWRNMMEAVGVFCIFVLISLLVTWIVRTYIDYRRWLRISRVQTEVHNKLLDRFAGTGELLSYIQSSPGRRFLESAPIPLDPGPRAMGAPFGRILWSVQAGVVLTVVGLGFQLVSWRVIEDIGQPLALIGVLAMSLGIGFILSGGVSYILARRLGLLEPISTAAATERQDSSPA